MDATITSSSNKEIPEELKASLHAFAALPPGERFERLQEIVEKGFVITIRLSQDAEGVFHEHIRFQSVAEAEQEP
jgi:hypothetical protein